MPVRTKTNGKNNKKDDSGFSFGAALLETPKSEGVGGFSFVFSSSSTINGGTESVSAYKGMYEKKKDASSTPDAAFSFGVSVATMPAVIASAGAETARSLFSFGDDPSQSVIYLPNKCNEAKAPASEPAFLFRA